MTQANTTLDPYAGWSQAESDAVTPEALKSLEGNPDLPTILEAIARLNAAPGAHAITEQLKAAVTPADYRAVAAKVTASHREWLLEAAGRLEQNRRSPEAFATINQIIDDRERALRLTLSFRPTTLQTAATPQCAADYQDALMRRRQRDLDDYITYQRSQEAAMSPIEAMAHRNGMR